MKKIALCAILTNVAGAALWAMPSQITFQGTLKQSGVPVNTAQNMQFSFVDNTGATIPGTSPIAVNNVSVVNGLFAVNLPINTSVAWEQYSPYIRVAVQGQILSPDQPINANLYAIADRVPGGSIMAYGGSTAPTGWLICDGSAVSRTTYSSLFAAIGVAYGSGDGSSTFNLPDLRGKFARGFDNGAGNDPDAAGRVACISGGNTGNNIGSCEADQYASHSHTINDPGHSHGYWTGTGNSNDGISDYASSRSNHHAGLPYMDLATTGITINNAGGNETRPKNVYVNYIIKY